MVRGKGSKTLGSFRESKPAKVFREWHRTEALRNQGLRMHNRFGALGNKG